MKSITKVGVLLFSATIIKSLQIPETRERLIAQGVEPVGSTQEEFLFFLKAETVKWAKVVKAAGVKPE